MSRITRSPASSPIVAKVPQPQSLAASIRRWLSRNGTLLLMALPGMLILFVFSYVPMPGIIPAFKDYKAAHGLWGSDWVGFSNFIYLFSTGIAWRIIRNTLFINTLFIIANVLVLLSIAVLLHEIYDHVLSRIYQSIGAVDHRHWPHRHGRVLHLTASRSNGEVHRGGEPEPRAV